MFLLNAVLDDEKVFLPQAREGRLLILFLAPVSSWHFPFGFAALDYGFGCAGSGVDVTAVVVGLHLVLKVFRKSDSYVMS